MGRGKSWTRGGSDTVKEPTQRGQREEGTRRPEGGIRISKGDTDEQESSKVGGARFHAQGEAADHPAIVDGRAKVTEELSET